MDGGRKNISPAKINEKILVNGSRFVSLNEETPDINTLMNVDLGNNDGNC